MMFLAHIAFSTAVVTSVLGFALLAWSRKEGAASSLLKTGGAIVLTLALLNMLCIGYYMVRYWEEGYFKAPTVVTHSRQGGMGMMPGGSQGGMMDCPMMPQMMKEGMDKKSSEFPPGTEKHEEHHP
jgi:lipoprotein signal peptidase